MCGIFALLNNSETFNQSLIQSEFDKGRNRGPEYSVLSHIDMRITLGFHRLAINGLDEISNQPIIINGVYLICNGEIYNYKELYKMINVTPTTNSDCEIIIHLYKCYGMETTLQMLDGVFAFVLIDMSGRTTDGYKLFVSRDPFGVRPLYTISPGGYNFREQVIGFASEMKMLTGFLHTVGDVEQYVINPFLPGTLQEYRYCSYSNRWDTTVVINTPIETTCVAQSYHKLPFSSIKEDYGIDNIYKGIIYFFNAAIKKRYLSTERPIACLLSGGLDSSSVVASINELHKIHSSMPLETYSIGLSGSEDLRNARIVADYLGTNHHEIILKEEDFFNAIESTIYKIESFDTTTVRASIPNSILCDKISQMSEAKVIFNGDGADELFGGYLYEYEAPNALSFDADIRRLLTNIWKHDVRRSDGSISSHGLEPRTPFLDRALVQFVLSIDPKIRFHVEQRQCEKYLFRKAFSKDYIVNSEGKQLLPDSILWRTKEAFSDGVSASTSRSLFQVLQEHISVFLGDVGIVDKKAKDYPHLSPATDEQYYYRMLFEKHFPGCGHVVPNLWMPRFVSSTDPSARTLNVYNNVHSTPSCLTE